MQPFVYAAAWTGMLCGIGMANEPFLTRLIFDN
jgi:hypothetical protein